MNLDLTAHKGAVWVFIVCNIGNQSTTANEKADNICCEWLGNGLKIICHYNCFLGVFFFFKLFTTNNIMSIQFMKEYDAEIPLIFAF